MVHISSCDVLKTCSYIAQVEDCVMVEVCGFG